MLAQRGLIYVPKSMYGSDIKKNKKNKINLGPLIGGIDKFLLLVSLLISIIIIQ